MTEDTLYIGLFQPFAQFRNPFTFYYAQSYPLPPKSTIIGMLQNAMDDYYGHKLGIDRWWGLKISVHGGFESVFWNYQQLIKGEVAVSNVGLLNKNERNPLGGSIWHPLYRLNVKVQRTPVYQQELFNGHLHIFIRGEREFLERIKQVLVSPSKILYLGRSEDVIFIKKVMFVEGERKKVEKSLWLTYPTYIMKDGFPIKSQKYPVYSLPVSIRFLNGSTLIKNKAQLSKNTKREVEFKTVIYTGFDYVVKLDNPLEIEEFKICNKIFKVPLVFGWL